MKKLMMSVLALSLISCSKTETKTEEKSGGLSEIISTAKNYNNLSKSADDVSKNIETLKQLKPLSNEELKQVLPETLMGMKRVELSVGDAAMMNLVSAEAKYKDENNKRIELQIMDGAGETGSAMVSILMMGLNVDKEKITETGFEKSAEINGMKAIVSEDKNGENIDSKIQMIAKKRYLLTLTGNGVSYEELKSALGEINMSELK